MRRIVVLSVLAVALAVSASAHAEKAGAITQIKIKCQAQWAALSVVERNTWTAQTYLTACIAGKQVPVHGRPIVKP